MTKALSLLLAAAVAFAAVPADAKTAKHKKVRIVHVVRQTAPAYRGTEKFPAGPIYYNGGTYLGDDPDPFIRSQIWRDINARFGGPD